MASESEANENPSDDPDLGALLDYLKRTRGFDLRAYKETGLLRRLHKRLQVVGIERYAEYLDYLQVHPEEFGDLFNTLLINVTRFFRDPPAWQYVADHVVPRLVERSTHD